MKKSLLLAFVLLVMVVGLGTKIIFAASENSNKPANPPGQVNKEENSQNNNNNNQGNSGNNGNQGNGNNGNGNGNQGNNGNSDGNGQGGSNQDKITFCHIPPGNPSQANAITADRNAWDNGHSKHAGDFIVDNCHPCPPGSPIPSSCTSGGGGGNNGGGGGSNNNNNGSSSNGSSTSTSEKQGEILGASTLAATGSTDTQLIMTLLQMLGAAATVIGWVAYGSKKI